MPFKKTPSNFYTSCLLKTMIILKKHPRNFNKTIKYVHANPQGFQLAKNTWHNPQQVKRLRHFNVTGPSAGKANSLPPEIYLT